MKRLLFIVLGLVGLFVSSFAQVSFGVKGGLNFNQVAISDAPASNIQMATGFHVGGYAQIGLTKKISFIPELQYCQRGYKDSGGGSNTTININYVEAPLLLSYSLHKIIGLDLGVDPSFKISTNSIVSYNSFDFGAIGGVRANLTSKFFLTARYYNGFLSISDVQYNNGPQPTYGQPPDHTAKTRMIQLGIGYKII